jgi:hypothetical protein
MASRAHVIHDYSFAPQVRQRRAVWLHDDEEVVLPRSRTFSGASALLVSAAAACALTAGLAYAVYVGGAAPLGITEAAPLQRDWQADAALVRANVTNQLSGPAFAVPSREGPSSLSSDLPLMAGHTSPDEATIAVTPGAVSDGSERAVTPAPRDPELGGALDAPSSPPDDAVYPSPVTTPPDAIAPSVPNPTPGADAENPYQDP